MTIKFCLLAILLSLLCLVNSQNIRYKRQGAKGERVQQQQEREYDEPEPQRPQRRPVSSVAAGQRKRPQEDEESINSGEAAPEPPIYGGVMGVPGVDFPNYQQIPRTSFRCGTVPYEPGMYADEETQCQAYHVCFGGRKESFLCGVGTVFNQAILSCDYWHSVDCASSSKYYEANAELGKGGAEPGPGGQTAAVRPAIPARPVQRPVNVERPVVQRPVQPQPRPAIREPEPQEPEYDIEPEREIVRPAPRPAPRPQPRPQPRPVAPRPSKTFVPQPQPRPVVQPRPVPQPRPISKTSPASKVSPQLRQKPRPQPKPIVQSQVEDREDQEDYETTY